jgi:hypothetical protein
MMTMNMKTTGMNTTRDKAAESPAKTSFVEALLAGGPAQDRSHAMRLYGWLIGSWVMDATVYRDDGTEHHGAGEIHFDWALEGRAIQDVWILPGVFYGTTLRVYDPAIDAWHILWSDPLRQVYTRQIGRAHGRDIIQIGKSDAGDTIRWSFTEITPESFCWTGERSRDNGTTWQLQAKFLARRTAFSQQTKLEERMR